MLLRWRDVNDQPNGITLQETMQFPDLVKQNAQIAAMEPVHVNLHARVVSQTLHVEGKLQTEVTYICSRCLTEHRDELSADFAEEFIRGNADQLAENDERIPFSGDEIDLDPYLEQELLLAIPYTPICKEDCAGLCPVCGTNRNETACECKTERIDPRLADLAKLLEKED